jgi:hypothetical protein
VVAQPASKPSGAESTRHHKGHLASNGWPCRRNSQLATIKASISRPIPTHNSESKKRESRPADDLRGPLLEAAHGLIQVTSKDQAAEQWHGDRVAVGFRLFAWNGEQVEGSGALGVPDRFDRRKPGRLMFERVEAPQIA